MNNKGRFETIFEKSNNCPLNHNRLPFSNIVDVPIEKIIPNDYLEENHGFSCDEILVLPEVSEVEIDYNVLREYHDVSQMDVLLVAAKKDEIQDLVEVVKEAKLKPLVVDIDAFVLQNVYELNYGFAEEETIAILNIGAEVTTVNIIENGISQFTRDIMNGGSSITEEIQKQRGTEHEYHGF